MESFVRSIQHWFKILYHRYITVLSYIGHCEVYSVLVSYRDKRKKGKEVMAKKGQGKKSKTVANW